MTKHNTLVSQQDILDYLKSIKPKLLKDGVTDLGLFGSYAKGTNTYFSDIDIALKTTDRFVKRLSGIEALIYLDNLKEQIKRYFRLPVDICDTASLSKEKKDKLLKGIIYV
ncbi:nucleotidyltransferase family protein [Helicobacter pullorum]|uniref:Putative nucleotidyltransferase n=1 Tax=Helicobacter pullorum TaxID=35818 RepID=A0A377Q2W4_9HELI|nr:nucleotidyltransferase domain-containing protein [Helicobacter pullorum]STQ88909.1 putative nucleotidyltransferase [Helicobacter pullorum]